MDSSHEFTPTPVIGSETFKEKLLRKSKADPFVPAGAALTLGVLLVGLYQFNKGNTRGSQQMMRYRVLAQGATVVAMTVGVLGMNIRSIWQGSGDSPSPSS